MIGQGDGGRQAWQGAPYSAPGVDGGGFTAILACAAAERVTAIAPALYPNDLDCDPERQVPTLSFHGTEEATIPTPEIPSEACPTS